MDPSTPSQDMLTVRRLRMSIGVVALALPFVLTIGNALQVRRLVLLPSISASYHTGMRDVFVGSLCAIGVFLICYRYRRPDDVVSSIGGALAIAVALFPTTAGAPQGQVSARDTLVGQVHQVCAAALFILLAAFCLVLFTRPDPATVPVRDERPVRHPVYRACGVIILLAIGLALASVALPESAQQRLRPVFWCETVAVLAFGVAWLVKGQAIIRSGLPTDPAPTSAGPRPSPVSG